MSAKRLVKPETAKRTLSLIDHFAGDLNAAAHDLHIGLISLGGLYTDRKSSACLDLINYINAGTPERQARLLSQLREMVASQQVQS